MPKEKDCLNNAVKNCCACREGEDNSVRSNTDVGPRGNIGIKIFGIILSALVVFFSALNAVFKSCYLAHIYQYFLYFYNRRPQEESADKSLQD